MLNVICAISTVVKPRRVKRTNRSIMEIPVTISAFNNGMFVAPSIIALPRFRMASIPRAASVPKTVASTAEAREIKIVV